jgi:rhodanese-related sulfurtransferase
MKSSKQLLAEANAVVETIPVEKALTLKDVLFVDLRDSAELQRTGTIPGAVHVPRGSLEFKADPENAQHEKALASGKKIVLFCASGGRSALAAKTLQDMGLTNVAHVGGGFTAWSQAGGPVQR